MHSVFSCYLFRKITDENLQVRSFMPGLSDALTLKLVAVTSSVLASPGILVMDAKAHALPDHCKSEADSGLASADSNMSPGRDLYGSLPG